MPTICEPDIRPLVVTAAFPFVPARLSLGHMGSTYVPADIYARYQRLFGRDCVLVSGIDVHSIQVSSDGRTRAGAAGLCAGLEAEYRRQFALMSVKYATLTRTDDAQHVKKVQAVLECLQAGGKLAVKQRPVEVCPACGAVPPPRLARRRGDAYLCPYCSCEEPLITEQREHIFLPLAPHQGRLRQLIERVAPPGQQKWLTAQLREPLPDWCISRDNDVGIAIPFGRPNISLYIWAESLIGYASMAEMALGEAATGAQFVHFFGKNILFYHAIAWPIILRHGLARVDDTFTCSVRGFLNGSGSDLSDIDAAVREFDPDFLRLALALKVPDSQVDFTLRRDEVATVVRTVGHHLLGNLLRRMTVVLARKSDSPRELDYGSPIVRQFWDKVVPEISSELGFCRVRTAVRHVLKYATWINAELERRRLYSQSDAASLAELAFATASMLVLLYPVMPRLSYNYNVFEGWLPTNIASCLTAHRYHVTSSGEGWRMPVATLSAST